MKRAIRKSGKTIVAGLGNPILGDDGVGWHITREVEKWLEKSRGAAAGQGRLHLYPINGDEIHFEYLSVGGISLMEHLIGYERCILVDAMLTGTHPPGTLLCFPFEDLPDPSAGHLNSAHDTSLPNALRLGRAMGVSLPSAITVVAVEAKRVYDFSEELSPTVAGAVPLAVRAILDLLFEQERMNYG